MICQCIDLALLYVGGEKMNRVNIRPCKEKDLGNTAHFISELNSIETSHIGYCGKDASEISHFIKHEITDIPYTDSFMLAYQANELVGLVGFDADLEDRSAEVWGPFIAEDMWGIGDQLWDELLRLLPGRINSLFLFPNIKNNRVLQFAKRIGCKEHSKHTILTFGREDRLNLLNGACEEIDKKYFCEMTQLHDQSFPHAYYDGDQIIKRLNVHNKVFIKTDHTRLIGYIYVEADPEFGDGSIEFFAVNESARGKGIGMELLSAALEWLFTFETIEVITLSVNAVNEKAIRLYKKVGFHQEHELLFLINER